MKQFFRITTLVLIFLIGLLPLYWILSQGITAINWMLPALAVAWLFLLGLWYLGFGAAPLKRRALRFFLGVGLFFILAFLGKSLLRYEGSASGSSFPKLSWIWQKNDNPNPDDTSHVQTVLTKQEQRIREASGDVTDFLGPDRDGMWSELSFEPDWNSNPPQLLWRRTVGKAWSSFVAKEGKAITQEQAGESERVTCLNLYTGEVIWHHDEPGTRLLLEKKENQGIKMGGDGPRSTPVIHGKFVYSIGATGIVNCLDLDSGNRLWTRNTIQEYGGEIQRWGIANSPLILEGENAVVVAGTDSVSGDTGVSLVAFDLTSGEEIWKYHAEGASYSSPRILHFSGVRQLVSVNRRSISGLNPATGEELWKHEWKGEFPKVAQPIPVGGNRLLVTASYGIGSLLLQIDREKEQWKVKQLWKSNRLKTKFSSPVILGDYAYGLDEGRLAAINLKDGNKVWKNQKYGFGQQLLFGDHLLVQTENGPVVIGKVSPQGFTEISRLDALNGMTWNVPVVAGRLLLVRNDHEAACYLLPKK